MNESIYKKNTTDLSDVLPEARGGRIPYRCPVCNGTGLVPAGFYDIIGVSNGVAYSTTPETCRSCGGSGVIR